MERPRISQGARIKRSDKNRLAEILFSTPPCKRYVVWQLRDEPGTSTSRHEANDGDAEEDEDEEER